MKISKTKITHGEKPGNQPYLIGVGDYLREGATCGVLRHYIILADSEEDAIHKFKNNLINYDLALKARFSQESHHIFYDSDKPQKMLQEIEAGWVKAELIDNDRAIPVSYFDDGRSNY